MCQGYFTLQEYPEHVSLCIGKKESRSNQVTSFLNVYTSSERFSIVFVSSVIILLLQENGLLSALDRTERRRTGV